ncbi:hypothetical protein [Saccharothrix syringae]|uniref:Uncharacterized protein n=1 Tax=Saccharothrix syringae TaxID=103733 RepID=A0A5Q0H8C7_SACSY|nr:hypothetical protein [Saccharothrix syringae]QFZ22488.1 hypothetical protein EKG83_38235 [Saccharothrix syringae]
MRSARGPSGGGRAAPSRGGTRPARNAPPAVEVLRHRLLPGPEPATRDPQDAFLRLAREAGVHEGRAGNPIRIAHERVERSLSTS